MTKNEPRDQRVSQLVDAAVAEFAEKGFENASMDSIAKRAGLTKGGLYHHFSSKDALLLAANELFMAPLYEMMKKAVAAPSPLAGLTGFLAGYFAYWQAHPEYLVCISLTLTKSLKEPDWWPAMGGYVSEMTRFYEDLLDRADTAGEIGPGDNPARATALMGAADGLAAYVCMNAVPDPKTSAEMLCRALAGPAPKAREAHADA